LCRIDDVIYDIIQVRLVLDTCVLVSAIRSRTGASFAVMQKAIAGEVTPVLSVAVLAEYADVLHRPENRVEGWRDQDIQTLIDGLLVHADWAEPYFATGPALRTKETN
jgi:predicted nucleic acid-binding protein